MRLSLLLLTAGLTLGLVACAGPQQTPGGPAAGGPDTPKRGGTLNMRVSVDPIDYDPTSNGSTSPSDTAMAQVYNSLLTFKTGPDVGFTDMILAPELAERWEVAPDGKTFTFHLRKGAKFANRAPVNGREFTSDDVKFTIEYYNRFGEYSKLPPSSHVGVMYFGLEAVEAPDKYTAVVKFKDPFVPFLSYMASDWNVMVPKETYQKDGHFKDILAGTGPYQIDQAASQKSTRYVWKKNPDFYDAGKSYVDEIRWLVLKEDATGFAAFQTKQIDLLSSSLAYPAYQQVKSQNPNANFHRYMQPQGYHLHFTQVRNGPLNDVRVRRALALTIDRDELNKVVAGGEGEWAVTAAMHGLFTQEEAKQLMKQDVNEAKRLLAEAGYPNGLKLEWPISDDVDQVSVTWFQLVQAQMKRAGVDLDLKAMDKNDQRAKRRRGDFDIDVVQSLGLLEADADSMMFGIYHSKGSTNWPKNNDPDLDKLLEAQRREVDTTKRREIQRQAAKRAVDQAWGVELIYPPKWYVSQSYVKNYYPHFSVYQDHTQAWLDK